MLINKVPSGANVNINGETVRLPAGEPISTGSFVGIGTKVTGYGFKPGQAVSNNQYSDYEPENWAKKTQFNTFVSGVLRSTKPAGSGDRQSVFGQYSMDGSLLRQTVHETGLYSYTSACLGVSNVDGKSFCRYIYSSSKTSEGPGILKEIFCTITGDGIPGTSTLIDLSSYYILGKRDKISVHSDEFSSVIFISNVDLGGKLHCCKFSSVSSNVINPKVSLDVNYITTLTSGYKDGYYYVVGTAQDSNYRRTLSLVKLDSNFNKVGQVSIATLQSNNVGADAEGLIHFVEDGMYVIFPIYVKGFDYDAYGIFVTYDLEVVGSLTKLNPSYIDASWHTFSAIDLGNDVLCIASELKGSDGSQGSLWLSFVECKNHEISTLNQVQSYPDILYKALSTLSILGRYDDNIVVWSCVQEDSEPYNIKQTLIKYGVNLGEVVVLSGPPVGVALSDGNEGNTVSVVKAV